MGHPKRPNKHGNKPGSRPNEEEAMQRGGVW